MPDYGWPSAEGRTLIGKRISRLDSPDKVSGRAKYTYDVHRPGMLFGKIVRSPHAKAKIVSLDTSAAEKMPGVKAVHIIQKAGSSVQWAGAEIVAIAAVDEGTAADAARAVQIKYQPLSYLVSDTEPKPGRRNLPANERRRGLGRHRQPDARKSACQLHQGAWHHFPS